MPTGLTVHDLAVRSNHITATDVAAIMGTSPWKTPTDIYLEKCLPMDPLEPSPAMVWGTLMEPVLAHRNQSLLFPLSKQFY